MPSPEKTKELDEEVSALAVEEQTSLTSPKRQSVSQEACAVCDGQTQKPESVLCDSCKGKLARPRLFCPEQIWSPSLEPASHDPQAEFDQRATIADPRECHAILIDVFGRLHLLSTMDGKKTTAHSVGRSRRCRISIADPHVSRLHAYIEYREHSGAWFVRHESRRNATRINRRLVKNYPLPIDSGHQLIFGTVGFYFRDLAAEELSWVNKALNVLPGSSDPIVASIPTQESARAVLLSVNVESWGGIATARSRAGGTVEVYLTELETRFLKLLLDRCEEQRDRSPDERGFVPSAEILVSDLPFDSNYPDKDNLKALVRRIRRRFSSHNAHDVIESRQGFGYRIHPDM
ncbi:MAG: FHA domain-containing protein [Proteobacteria bacterium]|nr:FHA domain-containing protein [Pseudomonadota bacterium]